MSWPKKILKVDKGIIFHYHNDMFPLDMAWYREHDTSTLTKVSIEDLDNCAYLIWNDDAYDWEIKSPKKEENSKKDEQKPKKCEYDWGHDWVLYTGFREVYEYCTICDKKRPVKHEKR